MEVIRSAGAQEIKQDRTQKATTDRAMRCRESVGGEGHIRCVALQKHGCRLYTALLRRGEVSEKQTGSRSAESLWCRTRGRERGGSGESCKAILQRCPYCRRLVGVWWCRRILLQDVPTPAALQGPEKESTTRTTRRSVHHTPDVTSSLLLRTITCNPAHVCFLCQDHRL